MNQSDRWFSARVAEFTDRPQAVAAPEHETALALVAAATPRFGARGYDGVSVREITAAAGANLGAITYHFGSKEGLYAAVVTSALRPLVEAVKRVVGRDAPPLERVGEVARTHFEQLHDHPWIPGLMLRVLLADRPPQALGGPLGDMIRALTGLVMEGQMEGSIRDGDPALMGISILSVPIHLNLVQRPLQAFTGVDVQEPETRRGLADHAASFVRAALEERT
ncbi:MAG: TetR/AcrR family transcriptional regulator [Gemmatimonadota bacterium]